MMSKVIKKHRKKAYITEENPYREVMLTSQKKIPTEKLCMNPWKRVGTQMRDCQAYHGP